MSQKLVLKADDTVWLYFDLEADPHEQRNRANDPACAAEIAALRAVAKSGGRL